MRLQARQHFLQLRSPRPPLDYRIADRQNDGVPWLA
jgi:hypothetical protein